MRSATPDAIKKAIPRRVQRNKRKAALLARPGSEERNREFSERVIAEAAKARALTARVEELRGPMP